MSGAKTTFRIHSTTFGIYERGERELNFVETLLLTAMAQSTSPPLDEQKVEKFVGQVIGDMSADMSCLMTDIGHRLGFYKGLRESEPRWAAEVAQKSDGYLLILEARC